MVWRPEREPEPDSTEPRPAGYDGLTPTLQTGFCVHWAEEPSEDGWERVERIAYDVLEEWEEQHGSFVAWRERHEISRMKGEAAKWN
jgi:hypothetical protein